LLAAYRGFLRAEIKQTVRKLVTAIKIASLRAALRNFLGSDQPEAGKIRLKFASKILISRSFRTVCKIFAPRTDAKEINRSRGAEIWCIKVRYPPKD
jgi:hypothetical protein